MKVTLKDFAASRNTDSTAIHMYLRRHPELRTEKEGKEIVFDESGETYKALDAKYPLIKPIQVVEGVPHEEYDRVRHKLEEAQAYVIELQQKLLAATQCQLESELRLAQAEQATEILRIEDKAEREGLERQLEELRNRNLWERIVNRGR